MVTAMDASIGEAIQIYKDFGLWDNTVVIFSSDNGGKVKTGASNQPLRAQKGSYFEGGIRTIGWIHSPLLPQAKRGTTVNNLLHVTDWLPTIMDLGQCELTNAPSKPLDGVSQAHTLFAVDPDENIYSNRNEILHFMDPLALSEETDPRHGFKIHPDAGIRMDNLFRLDGIHQDGFLTLTEEATGRDPEKYWKIDVFQFRFERCCATESGKF